MLRSRIREQSVLNAYWVSLNFQNAALITIAIPAALTQFVQKNHTLELAKLATVVALLAMVVPPVAGAISDRWHRRGIHRRSLILFGAGVDAVGLLWLSQATDFGGITAGLCIAVTGQSISLAPYQALIPEMTPPEAWGAASGYKGIASLVGTVAGLLVAGLSSPQVTFILTLLIVGLGAMTTLSAQGLEQVADAESVRIRDRHDFAVTFISRFWIMFGMTLLMTFVLYFFQDVLGVSNPSGGTALVAGVALLGAMASSLVMGAYSDRVVRKHVVALSGVPMVLAAAGFAAVPDARWIFAFAGLFGLGYGAFLSTDWALGIESVPQLKDVARDLGIWGIATGLPGMLAPAFGGWLLARYALPLSGYRALFFAASASFALGSVVVLRVGVKALSPLWGVPLRALIMLVLTPYVRLAYRVRGWGRLPFKRGPSVVISNHQHDLDTMGVVLGLSLAGPWRHPIFAAASQRLFEPGFMAQRFLWLKLYRLDFTPLFHSLGFLPLENQPLSRPLLSWAYHLWHRHGNLPLREALTPRLLDKLAEARPFEVGALHLSDLWRPALVKIARREVSHLALREPHRSEVGQATRVTIEAQLSRLEAVVRRGATLYLTPEGRYSKDGRLGRLRTALSRTAPLATVYLAPISYDPLIGRRLSLLYRVVLPADPTDLSASLKAARPITVSQLVAAALREGSLLAFKISDVVAAVERMLAELPVEAFVDPALLKRPIHTVRQALKTMLRRGLLQREGDGYRPVPVQRESRFPEVENILEYQACFYGETVAALERLEAKAEQAAAL